MGCHQWILFAIALIVGPVATTELRAADWPMWRHDATRSAASPTALPDTLSLKWTRELPPLKPAWPDQPKMQFDVAYEPIVSGKRLFLGSSRTDTVTAYDTESGTEVWRFHAEGPVRFAPLAWEGSVYFVSDDGFLYCVDAEQGTLKWKFRGGPSERNVLGKERLISTWPARGAPVIADSTVYFAAGIWPFMGIFLHALDARTGSVVWTNDGDGSIYMKQPHNTDSFAGVAPQGPLVVVGDKLFIPGGRSVPACYDRKTGKLVHYVLADNGKKGGGSEVAAIGNLYFNGGGVFDVTTGASVGTFPHLVSLTSDTAYGCDAKQCWAYDLKSSKVELVEAVDRKGEKTKVLKWKVATPVSVSVPEATAFIKAGSRLYVGSKGQVQAMALPLSGDKYAKPVWQASVDGTPSTLIAADDKLFVVTREGRLHCFGTGATQAKTFNTSAAVAQSNDTWSGKAKDVLKTTRISDGYCIAWGVGSGRLITELGRWSDLRIIVIEPDAKKADAFRDQLIAADLYGERVSVKVGDPRTIILPQYLASLMVSEDPASVGFELNSGFFEKIYPLLRPYGGTLCLSRSLATSGSHNDIASLMPLSRLPNAKREVTPEFVTLIRDGALPDTANWTHEHADAANTRVSADKVVKAPLGLLWFGGPSNEKVLPRHGHGPQPQVIDGRIIIEGSDMLRAMDVYTGRLLWESDLPGVGKFYDNTEHQPGANASGTNFISMSDGIYVAYGKSCVVLDPATGIRLAEFKLPVPAGAKEPPTWGYLNVFDDYLVAGAEPLIGEKPAPGAKEARGDNDTNSSSKQLVVMNRRDGKVLWTITAQHGFRHNAICSGGGKIFCIDRLSGPQLARFKRRGEEPTVKSRVLALDLLTGKELWHADDDVFGTWLSYSAEYDVLVEAGRTARDTLNDEPKGMRAYQADGGKVLWRNNNLGPAMLWHDTVLMAGTACNLLTGAPKLRADPLTGQMVEWNWSRNYGCNTPSASENLLTFRSGAAGYFDLCNDGGTGNFGGFRSSCTNNLIVANGVLSAPDYTRTCTCSYQNQTSLALINMPEAEMWTHFGSQELKGTIQRVGINLAAPGDRRAEDGTLWVEYPSVGGNSPAVPVHVSGPQVEWFRRHASQVEGPHNWIVSSGAENIHSISIGLSKTAGSERNYTVRLYFMEPDETAVGERVFDVVLQGTTKLHSLDIRKETGGRNRPLVKEFKGVPVKQELQITLTPADSEQKSAPVLSGVEIIME